jgi:elongation factor P
MALSITELKKGTLFKLDGAPYRVLEYSQKVMGRGGSIVNVRIKSLLDGKVQERTFKGNEQLQRAEVTSKTVQYLYKDNQGYHFMDGQTYEQFSVPASLVDDKAGYFKEGDEVSAQLFDGRVINIELPKNVLLKVTYTENAVRGDTSTAINKDATLETGLTIKVPAFIKQGDIVSVDTTNGAYRERAKS